MMAMAMAMAFEYYSVEVFDILQVSHICKHEKNVFMQVSVFYCPTALLPWLHLGSVGVSFGQLGSVRVRSVRAQGEFARARVRVQ